MARVFIGGVPFIALDHHDGRFVRTGGLFAFARHTPSDDFLVLHFEMAAAINRVADHSHARWGWCLGQRMDALLVHMAGRRTRLSGDASSDLETVLWHPEAECVLAPVELDQGLVESALATSLDREAQWLTQARLGRRLVASC